MLARPGGVSPGPLEPAGRRRCLPGGPPRVIAHPQGGQGSSGRELVSCRGQVKAILVPEAVVIEDRAPLEVDDEAPVALRDRPSRSVGIRDT